MRRSWLTAATCFRCGPVDETLTYVDGKPIVSDNFSDWDHCPYRHCATGWCPRCVHLLRHRPYKYWPHLWPDGIQLAPSALYAALSAPVGTDRWVTVPLSRQIHIAFRAGPGWVWTDRDRLAWDDGDVVRLDVYAQLRGCGFSETALAEPAPRRDLLLRCDDVHRVLCDWVRLDPWRDRPDYLAVAARATRQPKADEGGHRDA